MANIHPTHRDGIGEVSGGQDGMSRMLGGRDSMGGMLEGRDGMIGVLGQWNGMIGVLGGWDSMGGVLGGWDGMNGMLGGQDAVDGMLGGRDAVDGMFGGQDAVGECWVWNRGGMLGGWDAVDGMLGGRDAVGVMLGGWDAVGEWGGRSTTTDGFSQPWVQVVSATSLVSSLKDYYSAVLVNSTINNAAFFSPLINATKACHRTEPMPPEPLGGPFSTTGNSTNRSRTLRQSSTTYLISHPFFLYISSSYYIWITHNFYFLFSYSYLLTYLLTYLFTYLPTSGLARCGFLWLHLSYLCNVVGCQYIPFHSQSQW